MRRTDGETSAAEVWRDKRARCTVTVCSFHRLSVSLSVSLCLSSWPFVCLSVCLPAGRHSNNSVKKHEKTKLAVKCYTVRRRVRSDWAAPIFKRRSNNRRGWSGGGGGGRGHLHLGHLIVWM